MAIKELAEQIDQEDQLDELQPGTTLLHGQYTITRFLNNGGFGITYLAKDSLDRNVVIKECFADAFCRRTNTIVSARSRAHQGELKSIIKHFIQEARSLSKLVHPNIVGVHQVFEDNDTAYMAIDYVDGKDLLELMEDPTVKFTPSQIVDITRKMLAAVGFVHDHGLLHRDISPDNILINQSGEPILIDFGAAREHISEADRKHTALRVVKDGYSPQEFYIAGSEQGPWSDLYALAASLYHVIKGEAPINGQQRLAALAEQRPDPYLSLSGSLEGYPEGFLEAIDKALITMPNQRLQSANDWLKMLDAPKGKQTPTSTTTAVGAKPAGTGTPAQDKNAKVAKSFPQLFDEAIERKPAETQPNRSKMIAVSGLALVAVLGIVAYSAMGSKDPAPESAATQDVAVQAESTASTETQTASAEPAAAIAPAETQAEDAGTQAAAPAADEVAAAEPAAAEPAAAVEEPAAPATEQQGAYAVWDVKMPFEFTQSTQRNAEVVEITSLSPDADLNEVGSWLAPGVQIYTINEEPLAKDMAFETQIMNDMVADPDGYTRASVRYKDPASGKFERSLLAVPVVRKVGLADGSVIEVAMVDGKWTSTVSEVGADASDGLEVGDIILSEATTGTKADAAESIETIMADLTNKVAETAAFEVMRDENQATVNVTLTK